ncbi:DUF2262 domain-containing protein [Mucilaginibacter sp. HD30]
MLKYESKFAGFEGDVTTPKNTYNMLVLNFSENELQLAEKLSKHVAHWLDDKMDTIKKFAASNLLSLKNGEWLDEDEDIVAEEDFIKRIDLEGVTAYADGTFVVYFLDNDLFFGHTISVDVSEDFTLTEASI